MYRMGNIIGKGSFCEVIELIPAQSKSFPTARGGEQISLSLVLKQPRSDLDSNKKKDAEECTRNEINFLSTIQHPNIIKSKPPSCVLKIDSKNMIVLERLHGTLEDKINYWNVNSTHKSTTSFSNLWNERIQILSDIADAMSYLHSQSILLRDLKPENCGFDMDGNVKLFDFGLAVSLMEAKYKVGVDRYHFTMNGGTYRYMSPEALQEKPYGKASEVYTFALVVWRTMSLQKPFADCKSLGELKRFVSKGCRPELHRKWPKALGSTISISWSTNAEARPSFQQLQRQFDVLKRGGTRATVRSRNRCLVSWLCR
jgi:serine/threonine protein kinase